MRCLVLAFLAALTLALPARACDPAVQFSSYGYAAPAFGYAAPPPVAFGVPAVSYGYAAPAVTFGYAAPAFAAPAFGYGGGYGIAPAFGFSRFGFGGYGGAFGFSRGVTFRAFRDPFVVRRRFAFVF